MRKIIMGVIVALTLLSCATRSDVQVRLVSGEIMYVKNDRGVRTYPLDSIIVERYVSIDSAYGAYSSDELWGIYVGTLPSESVTGIDGHRTSRTWYEIGVTTARR